MPGWVQEGYNEYAKRLPREISLEMVEIPLGQRGQNGTGVKTRSRLCNCFCRSDFARRLRTLQRFDGLLDSLIN